MKSKDYAPIIIFTYNRIYALEFLIKNLQKNTFAKETDLFIFSDFAKNEKDIIKVQIVREFLYKIEGFKSISIIERKKNFGLAKNIIEGVTDIIKQYKKVIVLEDDLITSKNFIAYMNSSLDYYKNDKRIFSISGYTGILPSLKNIEEDVYLSYRPSSWGWGTWDDRWCNIDWDITDFNEFIRNRKKRKKFNRGGIDMTRMLKNSIKGKNHSWAIRWSYAMSKQNKYCIYPKVSKIQNIGFGEDATNCKGIDIYKTNLDNSSNTHFKFKKDIKINTQIIKEFRYIFSYTNKAIKRIENYLSRNIHFMYKDKK